LRISRRSAFDQACVTGASDRLKLPSGIRTQGLNRGDCLKQAFLFHHLSRSAINPESGMGRLAAHQETFDACALAEREQT